MKKLTTLMLSSVFVFGLTSNAQVSFGVQADGIVAKMNNQYVDNGQTTKLVSNAKLSWKAGVVANIPLSSNLNFMPQLNLLSKGGKFDQAQTGISDIKLTYLELPLYVNFTKSTGSGSFFGGIGPVLSFGLGGKSTERSNGVSVLTDVKFDGKANAQDDKLHLKGFEFGAGAIMGYLLKNGLFFNAHYNLGISNISPEVNTTVRNNYFGFGVGYLLHAK